MVPFKVSFPLKSLLVLVLIPFVVAASQTKDAAAYNPDSSKETKLHGSGSIDLIISGEWFGYDGFHWYEVWVTPASVHLPTNQGVGFDFGDALSFIGGRIYREDGVWWGECGYLFYWEMLAYIKPPPDCTLSIAMTPRYLPGFCWACVQVLGCEAGPDIMDEMPGDIYVEFKIGQEIMKFFPVNAPPVMEGGWYILVEQVMDYDAACHHHAFVP